MMPPLKLKGRDAKKDLLRIHGFMRKLIIKFFSWSYKSNKQIAFELGISEKTVENHITKALRHLRVGLQHIILLLLFLN